MKGRPQSWSLFIVRIVAVCIAGFFFSGKSFGDDGNKTLGHDNSAVLDILPGPNHTLGIRNLMAHYKLIVSRIDIDHSDSVSPITIKVQFVLPAPKFCHVSPKHADNDRNRMEAIWQAEPSRSFEPVNMWAKDLSNGHIEDFLPVDCPS